MDTYNTAWLWENQRWADYTVRVFGPDAGPDAEPLDSIHVPSLLLASASPGHFRGHSERLKEQMDEDTGIEAKKRRVSGSADAGAGAGEQYRCILFPGEPTAVPRATLQHLTKGEVPDDPEQLIWMLWRADYWDLAATVSAVLTKLETGAKQQLTLQHAALLSAMPPLQCQAHSSSKAGSEAGTSAPRPPAAVPAARVQGVIDTLLLRHLSCAHTVAADAALLSQFSQLPLALVKRWVELDKYEVDSGNTLAVLFTAWHDAQPEPPSEEQCQQLSALLPLAAVSLMFHAQALPHLKWWREPKDALAKHILADKYEDASVLERWCAVAGGLSVAKRACKDGGRIQWAYKLPAGYLEPFWHHRKLTLEGRYFGGYVVNFTLTLNPTQGSAPNQPGPLRLGYEASITWHEALAGALGTGSLPVPREVLYGWVRATVNGEDCWHRFQALDWPIRCTALVAASGAPCSFATRDVLIPTPASFLVLDIGLGLKPFKKSADIAAEPGAPRRAEAAPQQPRPAWEVIMDLLNQPVENGPDGPRMPRRAWPPAAAAAARAPQLAGMNAALLQAREEAAMRRARDGARAAMARVVAEQGPARRALLLADPVIRPLLLAGEEAERARREEEMRARREHRREQ